MSSVYFIQAGDAFGPIKIGRAGNVNHRLEQLQISCPEKLTLLLSIECGEYRPISASQLEAKLHRAFADLNIRGEWFKWHIDIAATINRLRGAPRNEHHEIDVPRFEIVRGFRTEMPF